MPFMQAVSPLRFEQVKTWQIMLVEDVFERRLTLQWRLSFAHSIHAKNFASGFEQAERDKSFGRRWRYVWKKVIISWKFVIWKHLLNLHFCFSPEFIFLIFQSHRYQKGVWRRNWGLECCSGHLWLDHCYFFSQGFFLLPSTKVDVPELMRAFGVSDGRKVQLSTGNLVSVLQHVSFRTTDNSIAICKSGILNCLDRLDSDSRINAGGKEMASRTLERCLVKISLSQIGRCYFKQQQPRATKSMCYE